MPKMALEDRPVDVRRGEQPAVEPLRVTDVRERFSKVFADVVHRHRPTPIARGVQDLAVLMGMEEMRLLLDGLSFAPEVTGEEGAVNIWLPEFGLYGRGQDLAAAREDLTNEVREYIAEYLDEIELYRAAPNRRSHFGHIMKALTADLSKDLATVLFPIHTAA